MGTLICGAARTPILIHDRTLAHLQSLISSKFRRAESFMMSWEDAEAVGDGSSSVWLHSQMDLEFKFDQKAPPLEREYLESMGTAAQAPRGLNLLDATRPWNAKSPVSEDFDLQYHDYHGA